VVCVSVIQIQNSKLTYLSCACYTHREYSIEINEIPASAAAIVLFKMTTYTTRAETVTNNRMTTTTIAMIRSHNVSENNNIKTTESPMVQCSHITEFNGIHLECILTRCKKMTYDVGRQNNTVATY